MNEREINIKKNLKRKEGGIPMMAETKRTERGSKVEEKRKERIYLPLFLLPKITIFLLLNLIYSCSAPYQYTGDQMENQASERVSLKVDYKDGFATIRWTPPISIKIKMKYDSEGAKTNWEYIKVREPIAEKVEEDGERVTEFRETDILDGGEVRVPVLPDRRVLFQVETPDGKTASRITELKTVGEPSVFINSYDDLRFRIEVSIPPYAEKIIIQRRGEDQKNWEVIDEVPVDEKLRKEGKITLEDKVPQEGVWYYRAKAENKLASSSWSREFFASPVVCLARREEEEGRSPRLRKKQAGCGWAYRRAISVTNNGVPETDVVIRVQVDTQTLISNGKMKADCSDVRFTDQSDEIFLPYWIGIDRNGNSTCNTTQTDFWVKIPYLPSGVNTIYMYYGNENADPVADPDKVFLIYDDMEDYTDGTQNPGGWTQYGNGIIEANDDGGNMVLTKGCADPTTAGNCNGGNTGGGDDGATINGGYHLFPFPISHFVAIFRIKRVNTAGGAYDRVGLVDWNWDGYGAYECTSCAGSSERIGIERRDAASGDAGSDTGTTATLTDTGSWNLFIFMRPSNTMRLEVQHSGGTATYTRTDANHEVFDRIYILGGRDYYVDDVAVAKYADVTVSVGTETAVSYTGLFLRRIPITLSSTSELRDFQVVFELSLTEPITLGEIRDDCGDLRFADSPYFEVDLWGLSFPYYFEARGPCGGDPALVGWWQFDEGTGTTASDSSGNGNNGTLSADAGWGSGANAKYGNSVNLTLDGTTDYVSLPGGVLNGKSAVSVSVWVKWTSGDNTGNASILSAGNAGQANEFLIYKIGAVGNDSIRLYIKGSFIGLAANTNLEDGNWHHIVVVWRSTGAASSRAWLYVNGVLQDTGTFTVGGALQVDCAVVGQETDTVSGTTCSGFQATQEWEGYIDDLRIFSREIAPAEVRALFQGNAKVWVKLPLVPSGTSKVYAYFGNSSKAGIASGDKVFDFFDDFPGTALNTSKWIANSSSYSVNYGVLVQTGNLVSKYSVAPSNVGRTFEWLIRWRTEADTLYGGVNMADDNNTSGSNAQADCVAYWMTQSGDNPAGAGETLTIWGADGSVANSYNVVSNGNLGTIQIFTWYAGGYEFSSSQFSYFIQNPDTFTDINRLNYAGIWTGGNTTGEANLPEREPGAPEIFIGDFRGVASANTNDIDDTELMWIRARKLGTQPTASYGAIEDSTE